MKKALIIILFAIFPYACAISEAFENRHKLSTDNSRIAQPKVERNIFVAKVNGYDIVYDLYYPNEDQEDNADSLVVYAKKSKSRTLLLSEPLDANYIGEVSVKYFLNHPFIYIATNNFHGDTYGDIYLLNVQPLKVILIEKLPYPSKAKAPKGYYPNKNYGIRIEENNRIFDGIIYRNDDNGDLSYTIDVEYKMIKVGNLYRLKATKQSVSNYH